MLEETGWTVVDWSVEKVIVSVVAKAGEPS
jgi:hypothetical protein